uniref:transmembrane protein 106B-like isoform X2 n=1 Tax=Myxine glutinosa TaxID=7769 RepID=UPI00358F7D30
MSIMSGSWKNPDSPSILSAINTGSSASLMLMHMRKIGGLVSSKLSMHARFRTQASEHVAIFSNHNGQFQPEKVKIYIALSIIISLLTSTLLFFFIFPRSVVLRKATVKQYAVSITGNSKTVFAKIIMSLTVENENFYTAHVMSTKTDVMLGKYVIGSYTDEQKRPVTAIGHQQFDVILEVNLDDFYQYCASSAIKVHNLLVNVRIMIVTKVIGTTDTSYIEMFQLIRCGMNATYNLQSSI